MFNIKEMIVNTLSLMDVPFWIINACRRRMCKGESKYGTFTPQTDRRNFPLEMEHELIDCMNYAIMQISQDPESEEDMLEVIEHLTVLLAKIRSLR